MARALFHLAATGLVGFAAALALLAGYLIGFGFVLVAPALRIPGGPRVSAHDPGARVARTTAARHEGGNALHCLGKPRPLSATSRSIFPRSNTITSRDKGIAVISGR
jgi:hypothetical protein